MKVLIFATHLLARPYLFHTVTTIGQFSRHVPRGEFKMPCHSQIESSYHTEWYRVVSQKLEHHHPPLILLS